MATRFTRPIGRVRSGRFGGGAKGSQFAGKGSISTAGLDALERGMRGPALEAILRETVLEPVYDRSQELVHVVTGELKQSGRITTNVTGTAVTGTVEYTAGHAAPEEFGANGREPHPFLRPAWDETVTLGNGKEKVRDAIRDLIIKTVGGA